MLGIEDRLVEPLRRHGDAVGDHLDILGERDPERGLDVEVPGLADQAGDLGAAAQRRRQTGIVRRAAPGTPRHAERGDARLFQRRRVLEEGVVGRVGAWPAALDIVYAEPVDLARDRRLVGGIEIDPLRLRTVAQGRVVEIDALAAHDDDAFAAGASATAASVVSSSKVKLSWR